MANYWDFSDVDTQPYVADNKRIPELLAGIGPDRKKTAEREYCTRTIIALSERNPEVLNEYWKTFLSLLTSDNAATKMAALYVIANMTVRNRDGGFTELLPEYAELMNDASVGVCGHSALNLGKIARNRADLRRPVIEKLLGVFEINKNPDRLEMILGYVVKAFDACMEVCEDKSRVISFVTGLRDSQSPSTRKLARSFLKDHEVK